MNHRAAIRRIDPQRYAHVPTVTRVDQPEDFLDAKEWRRLLNASPTLTDLLHDATHPVVARFFAFKFGPSLVTPWRRRYFIVHGKFLLWFSSDEPSARSLGCYYLPGLILFKEAKGKKHVTLRIVPAVPRRPGDKWKELSIAPLDSCGSEEVDVDGWCELFGQFTLGDIAIGEPAELETIHSVRKDRSGTTALGLLGLPPIWEQILVEEGFTAEDFTQHRATLRMVVDFARENQQKQSEPQSHVLPKVRLVFPSFSDDDTPTIRDTLNNTASGDGSTAALPHPSLASLHALVTEGDPAELFTDFVKLDAGSQGEVYKATRNEDDTVVALKKIFIRKPEYVAVFVFF